MSTVFVSKTSPKTVLVDYQKLLEQTNFLKTIKKNQAIILKLNLSWTKFYPACSSPPWQVEGVIKALLNMGFASKNIVPVENETVVTNVKQGAQNHFWDKICQKYKVKIHFLTNEEYIQYKPKAKMLVLDKVFPKGIFLPKIIINKPLISLCTMKTHVFTVTTGAIKNYFGMLNINRHFAHRFIHKTLVDLLQIQKELHPQILGIMDGVVVGSGPGPRAMRWHQKDYLLSGEDIVALDSIAAKMMGFDPLQIGYLKLSQQKNQGIANPKKIKVSGENINEINFNFKSADTFASRGQKLIYRHSPAKLERILLQTFIAPWSYLASKAYFDLFWYRAIGKKRLNEFFRSPWGKVYKEYST